MSADDIQIGGTHYKDMPMHPWDVMQAVMTPEEFIGFLKGNIIKYSMRAGRKDAPVTLLKMLARPERTPDGDLVFVAPGGGRVTA